MKTLGGVVVEGAFHAGMLPGGEVLQFDRIRPEAAAIITQEAIELLADSDQLPRLPDGRPDVMRLANMLWDRARGRRFTYGSPSIEMTVEAAVGGASAFAMRDTIKVLLAAGDLDATLTQQIDALEAARANVRRARKATPAA